jgi:serine/threonine-protein kinase
MVPTDLKEPGMSAPQGSRAETTFGPYYLKRLLGRGGMGEVYEAEHTVKKFKVALKLMSQAFSQDPVFRKRMEREARITGRLLEPHVVPIHDYGEIDGQLFVEMRLIEGTDLASVLEEHGRLPPSRAVAIIHQVASALDAAHAAGVTHRDVKPPNILVTRDDFVYLVDFGIASARSDEKLTQLGTAVGTWKYMAPERFTNDEVTHRADVYSLACVLYECLTGGPPYRADSTGVLITAHMLEPIPRPSAEGSGVPPAFDAVIERGMAKSPDDRYATAGALAAAAHEALSSPDRDRAHTILRRTDSAPTVQEPPSVLADLPPVPAPDSGGGQSAAAVDGAGEGGSSSQSPARQRKRWPIVAAAAVVVVAAVAGAGIWLATKSSKPAESSPAPVANQPKAGPGKTAPPSSSAPSDTQARLLSLVPTGYVAGACTPATAESGTMWTAAVAVVTCGQNTQPGGPSKATYGLFPTPDTLKRAFKDDIADVSLVNCPGEGASPVSWHYDQTPNDMAGMIACGNYENRPNVVWTTDQKLMLSDVSGDPATVEDLHTWWDNYG